MTSVDRKLKLLHQIARLRQAQQRSPRDRDLAAVRAELEEELGETVSQRLAARFLGVSHTALRRWVDAGDVPLVYGIQGRLGIPVAMLLELLEKVLRERRGGALSGHHLEAVLSAGRARAARMDPERLLDGLPREQDGHSAADCRALAYHRAVSRRLDRRTIDEALHRVWRWRAEGKLDPTYAEAWEDVLQRPVEEVRHLIAGDSARARELRQSSPLGGLLSEPERRRILEVVG